MRNFRTILAGLAMLMAMVSCSRGAKISGNFNGAEGKQLVVKLLDVNKYKVIDTLTTGKNGEFSCKVDIKKGQPEFIYLFYNNKKIASLLLQEGDKVKIVADSISKASVSGSSETDKLMEVERDMEEFDNAFASANARLNDLDPTSPEALQVRRDLAKDYISYYRSRVLYVMQNPFSLTVVPVLFQHYGESNTPVFNQPTDAIHFRNACDSLKTIYPDSRYVKALEEEAKRRTDIMELDMRIRDANPAGYPDLEITDIAGKKVKLSDVDAKVVMLYFWAAAEGSQKMFNMDVLKPLYETYHPKGLEIYAISLDTDKTQWANVIKNQQLPWINVCDGTGTASQAVRLYGVTSIPYVFMIKNGDLDTSAKIANESALRSYLSANL